MRATAKIGIFCLLLSGTYLYGQQAAQPVLSAEASVESSSNPHPFLPDSEKPQNFTATNPSLQVSDGNGWVRSSDLDAPAFVNHNDCTQLATLNPAAADLDETPGGGLALRNFSLHGEFTRDHMIEVARDFVPGKALPNAPSYVPLTSREKFDGWARHTYSADMLIGTILDTLTLQATGAYRDYGGGMGGFSKRYGTQLLSNEAGSLFGRWLFPTLLHQDPRYFPSHKTNVFDRMAYAASRAVITRSDSGGNVFNSSLLLTLLVTSALNNGYKPNYDESFQATMANTFAGLGATAQINLLNEFWPDIQHLFSRHSPKSAKYISHKVDQLTSW